MRVIRVIYRLTGSSRSRERNVEMRAELAKNQ